MHQTECQSSVPLIGLGARQVYSTKTSAVQSYDHVVCLPQDWLDGAGLGGKQRLVAHIAHRPEVHWLSCPSIPPLSVSFKHSDTSWVLAEQARRWDQALQSPTPTDLFPTAVPIQPNLASATAATDRTDVATGGDSAADVIRRGECIDLADAKDLGLPDEIDYDAWMGHRTQSMNDNDAKLSEQYQRLTTHARSPTDAAPLDLPPSPPPSAPASSLASAPESSDADSDAGSDYSNASSSNEAQTLRDQRRASEAAAAEANAVGLQDLQREIEQQPPVVQDEEVAEEEVEVEADAPMGAATAAAPVKKPRLGRWGLTPSPPKASPPNPQEHASCGCGGFTSFLPPSRGEGGSRDACGVAARDASSTSASAAASTSTELSPVQPEARPELTPDELL